MQHSHNLTANNLNQGHENSAQNNNKCGVLIKIHALQNIKKVINELAYIVNNDNERTLFNTTLYCLMENNDNDNILGINYKQFFTRENLNDLSIIVANKYCVSAKVGWYTKHEKLINEHINDLIDALMSEYKSNKKTDFVCIEAANTVHRHLESSQNSQDESYAILRAINFFNHGASLKYLGTNDFLLWDDKKRGRLGHIIEPDQKIRVRNIFKQIVRGEHPLSEVLYTIAFNGSIMSVGKFNKVSQIKKDVVAGIMVLCEQGMQNQIIENRIYSEILPTEVMLTSDMDISINRNHGEQETFAIGEEDNKIEVSSHTLNDDYRAAFTNKNLDGPNIRKQNIEESNLKNPDDREKAINDNTDVANKLRENISALQNVNYYHRQEPDNNDIDINSINFERRILPENLEDIVPILKAAITKGIDGPETFAKFLADIEIEKVTTTANNIIERINKDDRNKILEVLRFISNLGPGSIEVYAKCLTDDSINKLIVCDFNQEEIKEIWKFLNRVEQLRDLAILPININKPKEFSKIVKNFFDNKSDENYRAVISAITYLSKSQRNLFIRDCINKLDTDLVAFLNMIKSDIEEQTVNKFWEAFVYSISYIKYLLDQYNISEPDEKIITSIAVAIKKNSSDKVRELFVSLSSEQTEKLLELLEKQSNFFYVDNMPQLLEQLNSSPALFKMHLQNYFIKLAEGVSLRGGLLEETRNTFKRGKEYLISSDREIINADLKYFSIQQVGGLIGLCMSTKILQEVPEQTAKIISLFIEDKMKERTFIQSIPLLVAAILKEKSYKYINYIYPLVKGIFGNNLNNQDIKEFLIQNFNEFNNATKIIIQSLVKDWDSKLPQELMFIQEKIKTDNEFEENLYHVVYAKENSAILVKAIKYFMSRNNIPMDLKIIAFKRSGICDDNFEAELSSKSFFGYSEKVINFLDYLKEYYLHNQVVPGQKINSDSPNKLKFECRLLSVEVIVGKFGNTTEDKNIKKLYNSFIEKIIQTNSVSESFIGDAVLDLLSKEEFEITDTDYLKQLKDYVINLLTPGTDIIYPSVLNYKVREFLNSIQNNIYRLSLFIINVKCYLQDIEVKINGTSGCGFTREQWELFHEAYNFVWSPDELISLLRARSFLEDNKNIQFSFTNSYLRVLLRNISVDTVLEHSKNHRLKVQLSKSQINAVKQFILENDFNF